MTSKAKNYIVVAIWAIVVAAVFISGPILFDGILASHEYSPSYVNFVYVFTYVALFFAALILVVEIVAHYVNRDALYSTTVLAASILVGLATSLDAVNHYFQGDAPNVWVERVFATANFSATTAALGSVIYFLGAEFHLPSTRQERVALISILVASAATYFPLSIANLQFISFLGLFFCFLYIVLKLLIHLNFKGVHSIPAGSVFLIVAMQLSSALTYAIGAIQNPPVRAVGLVPIGSAFSGTLFIAVYLDFILRTTRQAYKSEQLENTLKALQSSALKNQIAPHFLFNSLQSVKTNYRLSPDKGDLALDLLSKHLRNYVESGDKYLVSFEKELDSVMTFVDLANLRTDRPFNLVYDIDEEDFQVPTLSIETLIENAILYSGVNDKEDGYIEISSYREGDSIIVRVSDNGKGFDVHAVREGGVGIKNAFERFRLLLGAECSIDSVPGMGTTIIVTIPNKGDKQ